MGARIRSDLEGTVYLQTGGPSGPVVLVAGDKVPDGLEVGAHLLDPDDGPVVLKGAELEVALEAAGLSKAGTADEKRARLAEAEAVVPDSSDAGGA